MLKENFTFCELNRRYAVLSEFTNSLFHIIQEKTTFMQNLIAENTEEANSGEKDIFEYHLHKNGNEC